MLEAGFAGVAVLILVAVGIQVRYMTAFKNAGVDPGRATQVIWRLNIGMLLVLLGVLAYFMLGKG